MMDDLGVAKRNLSDCLGSNFKNYLDLLKSWFRNELTKDEFDFEARKLFSNHTVGKHNTFLLALFNRCQDISSVDGHSERKNPVVDIKNESNITTNNLSRNISAKNISKHKTKKNKLIYKISERRFIPADPMMYTPVIKKSSKYEAERNRALLKIAFSSTEGSLPDHFMTNLRMLVIVWEAGLDNLSNEAVLLVNTAMRDFMKNIIMSVLTFKSAYRTYDKGRFRYAVGTPAVNPYLKNSHHLCKYPKDSHLTTVNEYGEIVPNLSSSEESAEHDAIFQIACANYPVSNWNGPERENNNVITAWQLFHALKFHKATIPSHSVYITNMEKIINRLSHKCDSSDETP